MKPFLAIACIVLLLAKLTLADEPSMLSTEQRSQLETILHHGLDNRGSWISVHAAESLIALHQSEPIFKAFQPQADTADAPYRIGVWRVLARAQPTADQRNEYVRRIKNVLLDANAPDRTHAMETLAKLNEPIVGDVERRAVQDAAVSAGNARPYALWRLAREKNLNAIVSLVALLRDPDATARARAAFVLSRLGRLSSQASEALKRALADEPIDSLARPALVVAVGGDEVRRMAATATSPSARYASAMYLADEGTGDDQRCLWELVKDCDEDVRVAAAFALLNIDSKSHRTIAPGR